MTENVSDYTILEKDISVKETIEFSIGDLVELSILENEIFSKYDFIGFVEDFDEDEGKIHLKAFDYGTSSKEDRVRVHYGYCEALKVIYVDKFTVLRKADNESSKSFKISLKSIHYDYNHFDYPKVKNKVFRWCTTA